MLLAIDTCGALGGVALGEVLSAENPSSQNRDPSTSSGQALGRPHFFFRELAGKTYSELLHSTIAEMLREVSVQIEQLSGVIVVHGPGSFTGIRIGVSAAKGLAEALGIPIIAISRLELLARRASGSSAAAVLDAGRGEFFVGFYRSGVCEGELLLSRDSLPQAIADSGLPVLVCEPRVFDALVGLTPEHVAVPGAVDALLVGASRFRAGSFDDVATLDANYLRRSETEMLTRIAEHATQRAARTAVSSGQ